MQIPASLSAPIPKYISSPRVSKRAPESEVKNWPRGRSRCVHLGRYISSANKMWFRRTGLLSSGLMLFGKVRRWGYIKGGFPALFFNYALACFALSRFPLKSVKRAFYYPNIMFALYYVNIGNIYYYLWASFVSLCFCIVFGQLSHEYPTKLHGMIFIFIPENLQFCTKKKRPCSPRVSFY